jgi:hypothetical protein
MFFFGPVHKHPVRVSQVCMLAAAAVLIMSNVFFGPVHKHPVRASQVCMLAAAAVLIMSNVFFRPRAQASSVWRSGLHFLLAKQCVGQVCMLSLSCPMFLAAAYVAAHWMQKPSRGFWLLMARKLEKCELVSAVFG